MKIVFAVFHCRLCQSSFVNHQKVLLTTQCKAHLVQHQFTSSQIPSITMHACTLWWHWTFRWNGKQKNKQMEEVLMVPRASVCKKSCSVQWADFKKKLIIMLNVECGTTHEQIISTNHERCFWKFDTTSSLRRWVWWEQTGPSREMWVSSSRDPRAREDILLAERNSQDSRGLAACQCQVKDWLLKLCTAFHTKTSLVSLEWMVVTLQNC